VFALPAFWTIDLIGRRPLLLGTFPFMAASLALIAIAFGIDKEATQGWSKAVILTGIYLFAIAYSPGEGPVPFVSRKLRHLSAPLLTFAQLYAAESMPLYNRDLGNAIASKFVKSSR
jgi:MFS family permease